MRADGDDGASRSQRQREAQKLSFFPTDAGMGAMYGEWAPERTKAIEDAVDLVADELWRAEHPNRNPTRYDINTLKYRRADALYQIARRILGRTVDAAAGGPARAEPDAEPAPASATAHGRRSEGSREATDAELTAAARAAARAAKPLGLLLIDYQTARGEVSSKPVCELADGTPIAPATMRRLLCDAALIPAVLNDRGEVLDMGRKIYLPTMPQRRAVFLRDRHCQFPGCDRPAKWSDVHHIVWWDTGGRTDYHNLLLLCGFHHHLVHEGGWRLTGSAMDFTIHRPDGEQFARITRGPP
jgi:hypothetical protein